MSESAIIQKPAMIDSTHKPTKKIAFIHDALCTSGGAERLVLQMLKALPEADFFTSVYLPEKTFPEFSKYKIKTLPGSKLIKTERQFKLSYPFWLWMLQRQDFSAYDRIFTSSTYLAKFINPRFNDKHNCYLNAPFRLLWRPGSYNDESLPTPTLLAPLVRAVARAMRDWDVRRTRQIKTITANSKHMAAEIQRVYKREVGVIYPPVDTEKFGFSSEHGDTYLTVSRLISHKRIDLAIQACNQLQRKLIVVGDGPERDALQAIAGPTIRFAGRVAEVELIRLYQQARALIFPGEEDFGIVPLEAQACGTPVIAFGKGGLLETVRDKLSGIFFYQQTPDAIVEAINHFEMIDFDHIAIRKAIASFAIARFNSQIQEFSRL